MYYWDNRISGFDKVKLLDGSTQGVLREEKQVLLVADWL